MDGKVDMKNKVLDLRFVSRLYRCVLLNQSDNKHSLSQEAAI